MLETGRDAGRSDLSVALRESNRLARRRGLVVVVSDFLDGSEWRRELRALVRRHDVIAVEVVDPRELDLVDVGVVPMRDLESGRTRWVDTSSSRLRRRFSEAASAQRAQIAGAIRSAGADHLVLRTDRDWVKDVVRHVSRRRRGRTSGRRP